MTITGTEDIALISYEQAEDIVRDRSGRAFEIRDRKASVITDLQRKADNLAKQIEVYTTARETALADIERRTEELSRMDDLITEAVESKRRAEALRPAYQKAIEGYWDLSSEERDLFSREPLDELNRELLALDAVTAELDTKLKKIYYNR